MGRHKNEDRRVNRAVRHYNKLMAEDELWRGRFILQQIQKDRVTYPDGSGTQYYRYRSYDKHTGEIAESDWNSGFQITELGTLFWWVNEVITKEFDVWKHDREDPENPYNITVDYRKVRAF